MPDESTRGNPQSAADAAPPRLDELLARERVVCRRGASSKKRALEMLSELIVAGDDGLTQTEIFESLLERERLGSTGLGRGAAIPHGRVKNLAQARGAFLRLEEGVDYDAADGRPVDMVFALLVPAEAANEHLNILALLAEMFSDPALCAQVRAVGTDRELYKVLTNWRPAAPGRAAGPSA